MKQRWLITKGLFWWWLCGMSDPTYFLTALRHRNITVGDPHEFRGKSFNSGSAPMWIPDSTK